MKRIFSIFVSIILVMLAIGAAMAESTDATASATAAPTMDDSHLSGQITAVASDSITITTMGGMQPGQGGGPGGGNGQGQPSGDTNSDSKGGTPPQGGGQQGGSAPQGDGQQGGTPPQGGQSDGTAPSATGVSITITVTDSTIITSRDDGSTISLSDLTVGEMVSVSVDGDATSGYTALTIEAGQMQQPQATDAATTTAQ